MLRLGREPQCSRWDHLWRPSRARRAWTRLLWSRWWLGRCISRGVGRLPTITCSQLPGTSSVVYDQLCVYVYVHVHVCV